MFFLPPCFLTLGQRYVAGTAWGTKGNVVEGGTEPRTETTAASTTGRGGERRKLKTHKFTFATHVHLFCRHCAPGWPVWGSSCVASAGWSAWWADSTSRSAAPGGSGTLAERSGPARCGNRQTETRPARWWRADRTAGEERENDFLIQLHCQQVEANTHTHTHTGQRLHI